MPAHALDLVLAELPWLCRFARRLTRDDHTADDLVQQTLIVALEAEEQPTSHMRPWLVSVLRMLARSERRADLRRRAREARAARSEVQAAGATRPDTEPELTRALAELPESYRSLIVQRYFEGAKPREIGQRSGVPARLVRTRLSRGLGKLRQRLVLAEAKAG